MFTTAVLVALALDAALLVLVVVALFAVLRLPPKLDALAVKETETARRLSEILAVLRDNAPKAVERLDELKAHAQRSEQGAEDLRESNVMAVQALLDVRDSLQAMGDGASS